MQDSTPLQMLVHLQEGGGDKANWGLQPATAGGGGRDPGLPGPVNPYFCPRISKLLQKLILITIIIMKLRPEPLSLLLVLFSQQLTKSPNLSEFSIFTSSLKFAHSLIMTSISRGNPGDLVVRCGEWDTQTTGEPLDHQVCSSIKQPWV